MAEQKVLNARIQLRYKTYDEWLDFTDIPLKGEMCIVSVPADQGEVANEPGVLLKIGDGVHSFRELPWVSAAAADVYSWAKSENKPSYSIEEIEGSDALTSALIPISSYGFDTNLRTNQMVQGSQLIEDVLKAYEEEGRQVVIKAGEYRFSVTEVVDDSTEDDGIIGFACSGAGVDFENLSINSKAYSERILFVYVPTLNKTISVYGTDADVEERLDEVESTLDTLVGDSTGSIREIAADEASKAIADVISDAPESFDTLKEIADWIASDTTNSAQIAANISSLQAIVAGIGADKTYKTVIEYVDAVVSDIQGGGSGTSLASLQALVDEHESLLDSLSSKVQSGEGIVVSDEGITFDPEVIASVEYVTQAITALQNKDSELANSITTLSGAQDGILTRLSAVEETIEDLADIAFSGSTDDLIQGNKELILNCN